jgi:pimeloyl-ACP methyl ester carboxylesterase
MTRLPLSLFTRKPPPRIASINDLPITAAAPRDLKKIDVPTLVIHGDNDQIVPRAHSGGVTAKIVPTVVLKVYAGASHGLAATYQDQLN